jgi:hypothetical protein
MHVPESQSHLFIRTRPNVHSYEPIYVKYSHVYAINAAMKVLTVYWLHAIGAPGHFVTQEEPREARNLMEIQTTNGKNSESGQRSSEHGQMYLRYKVSSLAGMYRT